jgi:phosphoribosylaminoimidazole-succinocarboxamide synthase
MSYKPSIIVLISGNGTNLQAIIDSVNNNSLYANIVAVVSHKECNGLQRAKKASIPSELLKINNEQRSVYDTRLAKLVKTYNPDIVVLAGWMRILTNNFISQFDNIINLHPALPKTFVGTNCIEKAYNAFQSGKIKYTGVMVHHVIEEVDGGKVIATSKVPINSNDSLKDLSNRLRSIEKGVLLQGIQSCISEIISQNIDNKLKNVINGKVRDYYDIGYDLMLFNHSDRQSAFDRQICNIPGKGKLLNYISCWWMNQTQHIIPNHVKYYNDHILIAQKTTPFKIEVVIRGYITGSTKTSLWTHYNKGSREYCGISFPDGLVKNQKLDKPVITPTTKGEVDIPVSRQQIVDMGYMTKNEVDFVFERAMNLFKYGQRKASERGLILVDTKMEFGKKDDGSIILIDELFTCDSSRFWMQDTYQQRFDNGQEPQRLDKDAVRNYIRTLCDPYNEPIPEVPVDKIKSVKICYENLYVQLSEDNICDDFYNYKSEQYYIDDYFNNYHDATAVIIAGSISDQKHVDKLQNALKSSQIYSTAYVSSAHKSTKDVLRIIQKYQDRRIVWITVAGRSNALSGVIAANTTKPVIACPPFKDKMDMFTNINSTLQMPSKVPVMTILEPGNVALAVNRIFAL